MFAGIGIFGSGNSSSLISALIVNAVQLVATLCAVFLVSNSLLRAFASCMPYRNHSIARHLFFLAQLTFSRGTSNCIILVNAKKQDLHKSEPIEADFVMKLDTICRWTVLAAKCSCCVDPSKASWQRLLQQFFWQSPTRAARYCSLPSLHLLTSQQGQE